MNTVLKAGPTSTSQLLTRIRDVAAQFGNPDATVHTLRKPWLDLSCVVFNAVRDCVVPRDQGIDRVWLYCSDVPGGQEWFLSELARLWGPMMFPRVLTDSELTLRDARNNFRKDNWNNWHKTNDAQFLREFARWIETQSEPQPDDEHDRLALAELNGTALEVYRIIKAHPGLTGDEIIAKPECPWTNLKHLVRKIGRPPLNRYIENRNPGYFPAHPKRTRK